MKFWLMTITLYPILLAAGLGAPALVILKRQPLQIVDVLIYLGATAAVVLAALVFTMMVARLSFPFYWWLGQVVGRDVFEYEGIYFLGLRLSRIPGRLQRILFGVDDQMRTWDLVFGLLFLVFLVPHTLGFMTANRVLDEQLPDPARFTQTLHHPVLSSMPVMRELGKGWRTDPSLVRKIMQAVQKIETGGIPDNRERIRLAQLYLLRAFSERSSPRDPFRVTPGERLLFDRGMGARAVEHLEIVLGQPEMQRTGWSGGALALIGFFHLSDGNYPKASEVLEQAVAQYGQIQESKISRYQVLLLAAQSAALNGDPNRAAVHLRAVLDDDRMPNRAYALALEQLGDLHRLQGTYDKALETLDKARELYKAETDRGGVARVHLLRAAIALDQGRRQEASEELSIASSLAQGLGDSFTLNMVEQLAIKFAG